MSFFEFPNTRTYDSDLGWLIDTARKLVECCNTVSETVDKLDTFYNEIVSGNYPDYIVKAFETWMEKNLVTLVGKMVAQVYFGLTQDGYFVAYIPESWDDIKFNTTEYDIYFDDFKKFGHLTLSY